MVVNLNTAAKSNKCSRMKNEIVEKLEKQLNIWEFKRLYYS